MQKWNGRFMTLPDEKLCLCVRSSHTHTHTHTDATGGNIWILSGPDQTAFIWAGSGLDNESWLPFLFGKFSSGPFGRARNQAIAICFTDTHTRAKFICVALCRPGMRRMRVYFISSFLHIFLKNKTKKFEFDFNFQFLNLKMRENKLAARWPQVWQLIYRQQIHDIWLQREKWRQKHLLSCGQSTAC